MKYFAFLMLLCLPFFADAQTHGTGLIFDQKSYASIPYKPKLVAGSYRGMARSASLEKYCPDPGDQGRTSSCVGWATAYALRTILYGKQYNITSKDQLNKMAFSPAFVYGIIKDSTDYECKQGSSPVTAFKVLKMLGVPRNSTLPFSCGAQLTQGAVDEAANYMIPDYQILFQDESTSEDDKVDAVKKTLTEGYPVMICFKVLKSFYAGPKVWTIQPSDGGPTGQHGMHAMCVVAYDDDKAGGAFKVMNSWGKDWGDGGFIWVPYSDFAKCTVGALQGYYARTAPTPDPEPEPAPVPVPVKPTPAPVTPPPPPPAPTPAPEPKSTLLKGSVVFNQSSGDVMKANKISTRNLVVEDDVKNSEDLVAYRMDKSYASGTRFRFLINTNTEAYIYAFATDLSGKVNKILPFDDNMSPHIGPNSTVAFPSETKVVRLDENKGTDYMLILYSTQKLDATAIAATMSNTEGGLSKKIRAALGSKLIDKSNVKYSLSEVGFELDNYKDNAVVPLMVEISHE